MRHQYLWIDTPHACGRTTLNFRFLMPLLFLLRIQNRKQVKMYHLYKSLYLYMMTSKNTEVMFILKYVEVLVSQYKIISFVVKVSDFLLFLNFNFFHRRFSFLSSLILTFELVTSIAHYPNMGRISKSSYFR